MSRNVNKASGMDYAPKGKDRPVVGQGEFSCGVIGLDHGHIYGMCYGLTEAGAEVRWVYDPDSRKVQEFLRAFPRAKAARDEAEILEDPAVTLVAAAPVPSERCALGLRVMDHGKDYFADKPPMTTLDQLARARARTAETGRKYFVYYSERLHVESAIYAGQLIQQGAIGTVVQVVNLAPHRMNAKDRPAWFFQKEKYGGILCDIGSHQIEQFLFFAGARDAEVMHARTANCHHPQYPQLEDFGEAVLQADNGASHYFRVDWLTPDGLDVWGDGRLFILGTEGYIEVRKYIDVTRSTDADHVFLVDGDGQNYLPVHGSVGFPFFGQFILDCLNRTENAMSQAHAFKAAKLCLLAQQMADQK